MEETKEPQKIGEKEKILIALLILVILGTSWVIFAFLTKGNSQFALPNGKVYKIVSEIKYPFQNPMGLAMDSKGNIYVSEFYKGHGNPRVLKFDNKGSYLGWLGKGNLTTGWHDANSKETSLPGNGDGEFGGVSNLSIDKFDNLYAVDGAYFNEIRQREEGNNRIQKFSSDGKFLGWLGQGEKNIGWHSPGSGETGQASKAEGGFHAPLDLLWDKSGNLLVVEAQNHRVSKFDAFGNFIEWLGKSTDGSYGWHKPGSNQSVSAKFFGTEARAFNTPYDIELYNDQLYVVSYHSDPVVAIFDYASGEFVRGMYHSKGYKPQSLILDKKGNIIFSDNYQGSVRFFTNDGSEKGHLQLGPGGDYFGVGDFIFDKEGYLYFTESIKNKVYKVRLKI